MADWSSVFEESGEEYGEWERDQRQFSPRTGVLLHLSDYSATVCYFFCVNYILGVGCLGIPFAFQKAGTLLSSIVVVMVSVVSYVTVLYVAEASHRGMQMRLDRNSKNPFRSPRVRHPTRSKKAVRSAVAASSNRRQNRASITSTKIIHSPGDIEVHIPIESVIASHRGEEDRMPPLAKPVANENAPLLKMSSSDTDKKYSSKIPSYLSISQLLDTSAKEGTDDVAVAPLVTGSGGSGGGLGMFVSRNRTTSSDSVDDRETNSYELEVSELTAEFLGPSGRVCYWLALSSLTFVGLLAYAQVFSSTFTSVLWPGAPSYVPVTVFGCVVVPLSCFELVEQISVQILMSILRFVSLGVLLIGTIVAQQIKASSISDQYSHGGYTHLQHVVTTPKELIVNGSLSSSSGVSTDQSSSSGDLMKLGGFGVIFTTAIFSQLFQHSVPGLIRPLSTARKEYVNRIFGSALVTTTVFYIGIGCACASYFGDNTKESINLNFVDFTWGIPKSSPWRGVADIAALTVTIFPALDTLSVFPLMAITLGNTMNVTFTCVNKWIKMYRVLGRMSKASIKRAITVAWRLVASIPPLVLATHITDLTASLQVAGLCGIFVALVTPALLQLNSRLPVALVPAALQVTPYTTHFSRPEYAIVILLIAAVAFYVCLQQMF